MINRIFLIILIIALVIGVLEGCGNFIQTQNIARTWQARAEEIWEYDYGKSEIVCAKIADKLIEEMEASGLLMGRDFVVVRGKVWKDGAYKGHICLEMYGSTTPMTKPKINGYRIDATQYKRFKVTFKGPYNKKESE